MMLGLVGGRRAVRTAVVPAGQAPVAAAHDSPRASGGTITGTVKAGAVPLPGVAVTATNTLTGKKYATTTDVNGSFAMAIPRNGRYVVKAELAAFATETKEVLINAAGENGGKPAQVAEFGLQLASRVQRRREAADCGDKCREIARGLQALNVTGDGLGADRCKCRWRATPERSCLRWREWAGSRRETDSVTVNGAMGQTNGLAGYNEDDIRQRVQDAIAQAQRQGGAAGDMANAVVGMLGGMMGGGGSADPGVEGLEEVAAGEGSRRWWRRRRISRVQSDAAAWRGVLSGRKWGTGCDELFADRVLRW